MHRESRSRWHGLAVALTHLVATLLQPAAMITATVAGTECDRSCLNVILQHGGPGIQEAVTLANTKRLTYDVLMLCCKESKAR